MTPEALRIAIAEACGYEKTETWRWNQAETEREYYWRNPDRTRQDVSSIPDYLNDLNAMHEAEKALTIHQNYQYLENLCRVTNGAIVSPYRDMNHVMKAMLVVHATAAQRAEAFLRTLSLWED